MRALAVLVFVAVAMGQFQIWQIDSLYADDACSGTLLVQEGVPVRVTSELLFLSSSRRLIPFVSFADCTSVPCGAGSVIGLSAFVSRTCSPQFLPDTSLSYRLYNAPEGDGSCGMRGDAFVEGFGVAAGCSRLSNASSILPACLPNLTAVFFYDNDSCQGDGVVAKGVEISVRYTNWPLCYREANNNQASFSAFFFFFFFCLFLTDLFEQSFWLASCPTLMQW